ncbi:MAG: hydantoinase/oxoprolinase family protein, partial [Anaerolineae bacterium]|nr:hydantoinase/oxoprolinase family protein [Anaerolineae bacterium]
MRVATDIGGTFTDLVALDEQTGAVSTAKVSTTPSNFAQGVVDSIQKAAQDAAQTAFFIHGSTIVINALTERKGVKTGLITTKGFRDVLEIGRANRPDIYNMAYVKPVPFVPRYLRREVGERLNYKGEVLTPLDRADVEREVRFLLDEGVVAIAVCFLHSYANPAHEIACGEIIRGLTPNIPVTLSHEITQEWREYERTNTAVLNSYVHPIARQYLDHLETSLVGMGMPREALHVMQSNGGSATFAAAKVAPIHLVESGPVAGV